MQNPIYLLSSVIGICALWFLWSMSLRNLFLDLFRERLFKLRFDLFDLGLSGQLPFDSEAYRAIETLLCGLLRYGHRITLLTFIFSSVEQTRAKREKNYIDVAQQITLKLSRLDRETQDQLGKLLIELRTAIMVYMSVTSLLFIAVAAVLLPCKWLGIWKPDSEKVSGVIEQEAYKAEVRRPASLVAA